MLHALFCTSASLIYVHIRLCFSLSTFLFVFCCRRIKIVQCMHIQYSIYENLCRCISQLAICCISQKCSKYTDTKWSNSFSFRTPHDDVTKIYIFFLNEQKWLFCTCRPEILFHFSMKVWTMFKVEAIVSTVEEIRANPSQ